MLVVFFSVLALLNIGHNAGVIWSARTPLEQNGAETERSLPFFAAARWLKANAPDATILTTRPRIIHYLSGCRTVSLVRSGVPDQDIWLDTEERLKKIIEKTKPDFFFSDSKDMEYYSHVKKGIEGLGYKLQEVAAEASSTRVSTLQDSPSRRTFAAEHN